MVARENYVGLIEDLLYLPLCGIDRKMFYLQPTTFEIIMERPHMTSVLGGILCKELSSYMHAHSIICNNTDEDFALGMGKTVMTLALILATLDDLSAPEEAYHKERVCL